MCRRRIRLATSIGLVLAHAGGRFIQQQQARPQRQRHGDLRGALVAVGEFAHQPVRLCRSGRPVPALHRCLALTVRSCGAADPQTQAKAIGRFRRRCGCFRAPTVPGKISVIWKVRAMPMATRSVTGSLVTISPSKTISPLVGGKKPEIMLKNVVLPAPFGPMMARKLARRHLHRDVARPRPGCRTAW